MVLTKGSSGKDDAQRGQVDKLEIRLGNEASKTLIDG